MTADAAAKIIVGNFEEYALDHKRHPHCAGCNGCLISPHPEVVLSRPLWCVGCKQRIEAATAPGIPLPWAVEFA